MRKRRINWRLVFAGTLAAVVVISAIVVNFSQEREVKVCNTDPFSPYYGTIITVRESEQGHYGPVGDPACAPR